MSNNIYKYKYLKYKQKYLHLKQFGGTQLSPDSIETINIIDLLQKKNQNPYYIPIIFV